MVSIKQLFEWFATGKFPNEDQFQEQFKSFWHKSERLNQSSILGLNDALNDKASKEDLANATTNFKSYHTSLDELLVAHPQNENRKDFFAWVGSPYPGTVYKVFENGGAWTDTGEVPTQQEIDLAEYLKKQNVTEGITNEKETVPSNFAVNTLQTKLYGGNNDSDIFSPLGVIISKVINEAGQLIDNANGQTTGLIVVEVGDALTFENITNVIRFFDSSKRLIIELPNTTHNYIAPTNSKYVATNDTTKSTLFCTIKKKVAETESGDIARLNTEVEKKIEKTILFNVSQSTNNYSYANKKSARSDVLSDFRALGQIITYKLNDGSWIREQYLGASTTSNGIEIFNPTMAIRGYTTEQDGTLKQQSDPKYGTTGFVAVVEGAKIEVVNKSYDLVRMFDSDKQFVKEISGVDTFVIPNGVAFIALNDNVNSTLFCTILTDKTNEVGGDIEIFNPSMTIRSYTTEQDGTLKQQSDPKYGTTGLVAVMEGANIAVANKAYDLIRFFDASKQFVKEFSGIDEFAIPSGVAYMSLNDNANSILFCTILTNKIVINNDWLSESSWESISGKASELLKESGFKIKVSIDDFSGSDIEKINTAIEFVNISGGGIVEITRDVLIDSSILMRSNVYLLFSATIKVADRTFDTIIRMAGVIIDPANPYDKCLELHDTTNIKILGVSENARIEGCDVPYSGVNPKNGKTEQFVGDYYGWRTISILLSNVKDYEVGNFHITKTKCWAISQEWGCENGYFHDIDFNTNVKNGDGIDVRNGCKNIRIENLTGYTSDDTVACTALDMSFGGATGSGNYVWVLQTMGFDYKQGDEAGIFDITISNVNTESEHNVIRCLATTPKVQNISMAKVIGKAVYDVVVIHTGYGNGFVKGNLKDIYVNDVTNTSNARTIGCDAPLVDGWFNKINGIVFVNNNAENVRVTNN